MSDSYNYPELLHTEMLNLIDAIEHILEDHNLDSDDIVFIRFFFEQMSSEKTMQHVISRVLPWSKQIKNRDDDFFYNNKHIFGDLPKEKVDYVSKLWKSDVLDNEDKDEIWQFFEVFVLYAEKFKKCQ